MSLNELRDEIHQNALNKGFWEGVPRFSEKLMLVVSELGECCEADRKNNHADIDLFINGNTSFGQDFEKRIKNTVEDELADTVIRVLDICGYYNIDIETFIKLKMQYNTTREFKHGKEY